VPSYTLMSMLWFLLTFSLKKMGGKFFNSDIKCWPQCVKNYPNSGFQENRHFLKKIGGNREKNYSLSIVKNCQKFIRLSTYIHTFVLFSY
jgi:hypothetical protein